MKSKYKIIIHLVFWIYIVNQALFPVYLNKIDTKYLQDNLYLKDIFITTLLNIFVFYSIYFSIPRLLNFRRKWYIFPFVILFAILLSAVRFPMELAYWKYIVVLPAKDLAIQSEWIWATLKITLIISIYGMLIRFSIDWFESQKYKDELIKQQQASEIELLRAQINPHFLFNTLNNIYSMVLSKSNEAPDAVMKLSSIMRYMLYESNTEKVSLIKEIEYLNSFIELQQIRIPNKGFIEMNIIGNIADKNIAPMLLIPFVENAFKHGDRNSEPGIFITLQTDENKLFFSVKNYKKPINNSVDESGGFGLKNIEKRLKLLYNNKYKLIVQNSDEWYKIELTLHN